MTQEPARGVLSRRAVLVGAAAAAGVGALAACQSSSGSGGSAATSPGAGAGSAAGGSPPPTGSAGLVALADVPVGGAVTATTAAGDAVVVAQPEAGTVVAFSAHCTHRGCLVAPRDAELVCPCHGAVYKAATGEVVQGPATEALPAVAVHLDGDRVVEG